MSNPDVLVVGAGNAALASAISASEMGARVLICEAASEEAMGGNSRFTFAGFRLGLEDSENIKCLIPGISNQELAFVRENPYTSDDFYTHLMRLSCYKADSKLCHMLANESFNVLKWMKGLGIEWDLSISEFPPDPVWKRSPGSVFAKGRGKGLIKRLLQSVASKGIEILYDMSLERLEADGGRVRRAVFSSKEHGIVEIMFNSVILACGSFEANKEMRQQYMGRNWADMKVRGSQFNTGKGLYAALEVGAQIYGDWTKGHGVPINADTEDFGLLSLGETTRRCLFQYSVSVNEQGHRFFDEGRSRKIFMYGETGAEVASQSSNRAFQIFDAKIVNAPAFEQLMYFSSQNHCVANSLTRLADMISVPRRTFVKEIEEYNAAVDTTHEFNTSILDGRSTVGINPPRSNYAVKLDMPPFFAFPVCGGITFSYGGIKTNVKSQVLDFEDKPIPGLYAAGEMTGGYFMQSYPANAGLVRGAVTGYSAGRNIES